MDFEAGLQQLCANIFLPIPDNFEVRPGPWPVTESETDNKIRMRVYNDMENLVPIHEQHKLRPLREALFQDRWKRPDIMTGAGFGWASSELLSYYEKVEALYPHKNAKLLNSLSREKFFFTVGPATVTICETPVKYQLHDAKEPAVVFPDGQKFHVLQGVSVPSLWPDFEGLSGPQWSVLGDRLEWTGLWPRIPEHFGKRLIDRNPDPTVGTLWGVRFFDPESRFLEVLCPTGRIFYLRVPSDVQTAQAGQERLWGTSYRPGVQR